MIGNSVRSDVLPVVELGGWAVHVPAALSWAHEDAEVPDAARPRCLEVQTLADVVELVRSLETRGGASPVR
jgi:putative hydrolase of the HAD superfamily